MSKVLFSEYPLVVDRELAGVIGLNEAIVIQQIWHWMESAKKIKDEEKRNDHFIDGRWWTWHTIEEWRAEFPFWCEKTIRRTISKLQKDGLIVTGCFNKAGFDHTKWYSVDIERLEKRMDTDLVKMTRSKRSKCPNPIGQFDQTNTKDTTKNTKPKKTDKEYKERTSEEDAPLLSPHDEIGIDNKEWEWQSEYQYKTYMEKRMPEFVWSIVHDSDFIDKKHAHRILVAVTTEYFKQYSRKTGKLHPWYSEKHLRECFDELFEYGGGRLNFFDVSELMKEFFKHDGARDYHFKVFATQNMLRYCEALIDQDTETLMAFNDGEYAFA